MGPEEVLVKIGTVAGKVGDVVEIPIDFLQVPENAIVGCDFVIGYDSSVLDIVDIIPGSIVMNPSRSFDTAIYSESGEIIFLFSENSGTGAESIYNAGLFATIKVKIKDGEGFSPVALVSVGIWR